jgi:5-methylcytosine-specific restriction endonuclease McrA
VSDGTCTAPDCGRPRHGRQAYCKMHYSRWHRNGHTERVLEYRVTCEIDGCDKPHTSRGMCPMHYRRWRVNGDANIVQKVRGQGACYAEGCSTQAASLGLCDRHYRRMRKYGSTELPEAGKPECMADGCTSDAYARGACTKHYRRLITHGPEGLTRGDPRACTLDGCDRPFYAFDLCRQHWSDGYRARNRERIAQYSALRREQAATGMSRVEVAEALEYRILIAGNPCVYCGAPADTVDHIDAVHLGGTDRWGNLAPACQSCNSSKKIKTPLEFMLWRLARGEGAGNGGSARQPAGAA